MKKYKILLVDDDKDISEFIKDLLFLENIDTITANTGSRAKELLLSSAFDLIILDIMLHDTDGFELFKYIQKQEITTSIIFLSGKDQDHDKILAFGMGADDYITKPFSASVFIARIKAHLRRNERVVVPGRKIERGPFKLNLDTYQLFKDGNEIILSSKEIKLMKFLLENSNIVFTRDQLYESIWNDMFIENNAITVHIKNLRKKIEDNPKNPEFLKTVWGVGYKFII